MRISRWGFCALTSLFCHPSVSGNVRVCHPRGCLISVPIGGFVGDHPSDATTGVFDISVVSGNEVNVGVGDGLAGCLVGVDADVEPVGVEVFDE